MRLKSVKISGFKTNMFTDFLNFKKCGGLGLKFLQLV